MRAIELLEASKTPMVDVVYELTEMPASEVVQHQHFLYQKLEHLSRSKDTTELFRTFNMYWTYLSPDLLKHLVRKLPALSDMKGDMDVYISHLDEFKRKSPLKLFCVVNMDHIEPPEGFAMIATMLKDKKQIITLQDVEVFRRMYGRHYELYKFALMLHDTVIEPKISGENITFCF